MTGPFVPFVRRAFSCLDGLLLLLPAKIPSSTGIYFLEQRGMV
ncbi:MAG: hypothetical protein JWO91_1400 [Acidobacteriaceae bacterium]|nr:hypothetical protein [Acidobacteriaceae bacterium]